MRGEGLSWQRGLAHSFDQPFSKRLRPIRTLVSTKEQDILLSHLQWVFHLKSCAFDCPASQYWPASELRCELAHN